MSDKNNALKDQFNKKKNASTGEDDLVKKQLEMEKAIGERNKAKRAEESTFWGGLKKGAKDLYDYGARRN
jgi:hypothetical protein